MRNSSAKSQRILDAGIAVPRIPESNHTHWSCVRSCNVNVVAHVLIAELFDVGFLLLIVAEPVKRVRLQFALPVLSDIVRDMLGTKSFPQVSVLVASRDVGPRTNISPNVGYGG
jgi:hypothetical protein